MLEQLLNEIEYGDSAVVHNLRKMPDNESTLECAKYIQNNISNRSIFTVSEALSETSEKHPEFVDRVLSVIKKYDDMHSLKGIANAIIRNSFDREALGTVLDFYELVERNDVEGDVTEVIGGLSGIIIDTAKTKKVEKVKKIVEFFTDNLDKSYKLIAPGLLISEILKNEENTEEMWDLLTENIEVNGLDAMIDAARDCYRITKDQKAIKEVFDLRDLYGDPVLIVYDAIRRFANKSKDVMKLVDFFKTKRTPAIAKTINALATKTDYNTVHCGMNWLEKYDGIPLNRTKLVTKIAGSYDGDVVRDVISVMVKYENHSALSKICSAISKVAETKKIVEVPGLKCIIKDVCKIFHMYYLNSPGAVARHIQEKEEVYTGNLLFQRVYNDIRRDPSIISQALSRDYSLINLIDMPRLPYSELDTVAKSIDFVMQIHADRSKDDKDKIKRDFIMELNRAVAQVDGYKNQIRNIRRYCNEVKRLMIDNASDLMVVTNV